MAALAAIAVAGLLRAGGCATLPKTDITTADDGNLVVDVQEEQSVLALAVSVYDDRHLARPLAEAADLPYDEPVPAGTVLTLPPKRVLKDRLSAAKKADKLFGKGEDALRKGKYDEAVERYRAALALRPERTDARRQLGKALLRTGELDESYRLLAEAAQRDPDDADTRHALGVVLRRRGDLEAALVELNAAVELDETLARAAYDRARTLHDLGRFDEARRAYQTFLYAFPSDPWVEDARHALEELDEP
jgi:tetratricopeptide (TPR) repeat protein